MRHFAPNHSPNHGTTVDTQPDTKRGSVRGNHPGGGILDPEAKLNHDVGVVMALSAQISHHHLINHEVRDENQFATLFS